jgi:hypothetical protein
VTTSPKELLVELLSGPDAGNLSTDFLERVERLFEARGDVARARWMRFEREGYGARTELATLADLLGADPASGLVRAVLQARLQHGRVMVGGVARQWPHFFVESVEELRRWEERARRSGVATIEIEIDVPKDAATPRALSFPCTVFGDVLDRVALEIGDALRLLGGPS